MRVGWVIPFSQPSSLIQFSCRGSKNLAAENPFPIPHERRDVEGIERRERYPLTKPHDKKAWMGSYWIMSSFPAVEMRLGMTCGHDAIPSFRSQRSEWRDIMSFTHPSVEAPSILRMHWKNRQRRCTPTSCSSGRTTQFRSKPPFYKLQKRHLFSCDCQEIKKLPVA